MKKIKNSVNMATTPATLQNYVQENNTFLIWAKIVMIKIFKIDENMIFGRFLVCLVFILV